ncbi:hypothetical protein [Qipengyuania sp. MTN3-11]|uniref:YunG family protein n=1 Tax=Qipengyuania sp. MTN3-11 TaxID=3056557 RepID=UPI0036F43BBF
MTSAMQSFAAVIGSCWSAETATTYSAANPARGQCSVTALLALEVVGGSLAKTRVEGAWHFYNVIEGERVDLTVGQFERPISYRDLPATVDEALADCSPQQLAALRAAWVARSATACGVSVGANISSVQDHR